MRITEIALSETIDNYLPGDEEAKSQIAQSVYDLLQSAYVKIGGIKGSGFNSPEDMVQNIPMWKVFRRGDDIKAVLMYKDRNGRKMVALGTDGSRDGKLMLKNIVKAEYTTDRSFGEVSGPALRFVKSALGDEIFNAKSIPAADVQAALPNDNIRPVDDEEYEREITPGNWMKKRMMGTPGKTITPRQ